MIDLNAFPSKWQYLSEDKENKDWKSWFISNENRIFVGGELFLNMMSYNIFWKIFFLKYANVLNYMFPFSVDYSNRKYFKNENFTKFKEQYL